MTKPSATKNEPRKQHSPAFQDQALELAQCIGVAAAARERGYMNRNFIPGAANNNSN